MTTLDGSVRLLHAVMDTFADAKRFNERWLTDPAFRARLRHDPDGAVAAHGIAADPDEVRGMVTGDTARAGTMARGVHAITAAKSAVMKRWYGPEARAADVRLAAWRDRQRARMTLELGPFPTNSAIHAAWSAELTRGCSGGCWFCNMAAPSLNGIAPSDEPALAEWREIVAALARRLGPAVRTGYLDGASDPFDHPAYEAFCRVVAEEAGFYPPTATALALRDVDRARRFFAEARAAGCWSIRLTVRDREELDALHAAFTSAELAHVQINALTPESVFVYSITGRARERWLADPAFAADQRRRLAFAPWHSADPAYHGTEDHPLDASPGLVGFGLKMVDRTVSLVAPRPASDTRPLGMAVLETRPFVDASGLDAALEAITARWMPPDLRPDDHLALWDGLTPEAIDGGVRFHGRFHQYTDITDAAAAGDIDADRVRSVADGLRAPGLRLRDLRGGTDADIARRMWRAGLLEETG